MGLRVLLTGHEGYLVHARAFNAGRDGHDFRIAELAEMVAAALPATPVRLGDDAQSDPRSYRVNCSRLAETLPAYRTRWTVEEGIRELVAAFERTGCEEEDLASGRYMRSGEIRRLVEEGRLDEDLRGKDGAAPAGPRRAELKEVAR